MSRVASRPTREQNLSSADTSRSASCLPVVSKPSRASSSMVSMHALTSRSTGCSTAGTAAAEPPGSAFDTRRSSAAAAPLGSSSCGAATPRHPDWTSRTSKYTRPGCTGAGKLTVTCVPSLEASTTCTGRKPVVQWRARHTLPGGKGSDSTSVVCTVAAARVGSSVTAGKTSKTAGSQPVLHALGSWVEGLIVCTVTDSSGRLLEFLNKGDTTLSAPRDDSNSCISPALDACFKFAVVDLVFIASCCRSSNSVSASTLSTSTTRWVQPRRTANERTRPCASRTVLSCCCQSGLSPSGSHPLTFIDTRTVCG
mmetsp:Transcript_20214/g.60031  ORF Transcript_20214/g.60031 Transcript_20214/m.60031 type:complete len:311 (+) Transcript_20214:1241-2173(+)